MRKVLAYILVFTMLVFLVGCEQEKQVQEPVTTQGVTTNATFQYDDNFPKEVGSLVNQVKTFQNPTLDSLTECIVKDNGAILAEGALRVWSGAFGRQIGLGNMQFGMPIEYIKEINDTLVYTVHKINDEGNVFYRYTVFEQSVYEGKETWGRNGFYLDEDCKEEESLFTLFMESYNVVKSLSSVDFQTIQIGNTAKELYEIDPIVEMDLKEVPGGRSLHLLSDGLLIFEYEYIGEAETGVAKKLEDYKILSKTFYPFGTQDPAAENFKILQAQEPIELP